MYHVLVYRSGNDREEIVSSAQDEINRLGEWCESHNGKLHPDKACVLWCSLNNRAVKTDMPTVSIQGKTLSREHSLKYLGITFDRSLSFNLGCMSPILSTVQEMDLLQSKRWPQPKCPNTYCWSSTSRSFCPSLTMDWVSSHCQQPNFKDSMSYKMKA